MNSKYSNNTSIAVEEAESTNAADYFEYDSMVIQEGTETANAMNRIYGLLPKEFKRATRNLENYPNLEDMPVIPLRDLNGEIIGLRFINLIKGNEINIGNGNIIFNEKSKSVLLVTEDSQTAYKLSDSKYKILLVNNLSQNKAQQIKEKFNEVCIVTTCDHVRDLKRRLVSLNIKIIGLSLPVDSFTCTKELENEINNLIASTQLIDWKEPQPIRAELLPVKKITKSMLPMDLADYVFDEAERADKMPVDFVAVTLLSSLGSVLGTKVTIKPKPLGDWRVMSNLWSAIVGTPSMKKSPAYEAGLRPISQLIDKEKETSKSKDFDMEIDKIEINHNFNCSNDELVIKMRAEKLSAEQELKELKKELTKIKDEIEREELFLKIAKQELRIEANKKNEVANKEDIPEKRYKTDDTTIEALSDLEVNNPNGILVFRDELVGLFAFLEKDGGLCKPFFLEGWNGTGSYQVDRIGRGPQFIPNHCLTVMGGIQPDKLIKYLEPAIKGLGNDGLIQRFQLIVYPDVESWEYVDRIPNKDARNAVYSIFESMDELNEVSLHDIGAYTSDNYNKKPYFVFSDEAQNIFREWMTLLHKEKIPREEHPIIQEHLSKYPKLLAGLALLFHVIDGINLGSVGGVSKSAIEMAIEWCEYLESHARRIYGLVLHSSNFRASTLANKLKKLPESDKWRTDGFSARELFRKNWKSLTDMQNIYEAVDILNDACWVHVEEIEATVKGGRPTKRYWINPKIYEMS
ncbi:MULTISPECIES: YfjI family protein [unclassified Acinetobacter]|uniref:YfjI family protein n=1 Tax=unclassified Acinetobacter TaxID=196816 RepID=UPI0015D0F5D1|nr:MULTISPECIES: YfjI family protein [unclassified Acinetobacter]